MYIIIIKYGQGDSLKDYYFSLFNYLKNHEDKLKNRGQVKVGQHHWLELDNNPSSKYIDLFEKEKIMYGEIVPEPRFIYDEGNYYMEATGFILNSTTINLRYLLGLLNSNLLFWYFKDIGYNLGGKGYRYKKMFIEQLPIKFTNSNTENEIQNFVSEIMLLNKSLVKNIDEFSKILFKEYNIKKISKNLETFYKLSINDFLKEIIKQNKNIDKNKLSLEFQEYTYTINEILKKIGSLEKEMNDSIYKIYNLNKNEIKIIEDSF